MYYVIYADCENYEVYGATVQVFESWKQVNKFLRNKWATVNAFNKARAELDLRVIRGEEVDVTAVSGAVVDRYAIGPEDKDEDDASKEPT